MQPTINYIKGGVILLIILAIVFGLGYYCKSVAPIQQTSISRSDTLYMIDTANHVNVSNNFHTTNSYTLIPEGLVIDTGEIIKNYFTKRFVCDTINDSLIQLSIFDTLYNNKIVSRKTAYRLLKPYNTVITTTTIPLPVSQVGFYAGAFFGFNKSFVQAAGVEANLVTPKINYGLGYDFKNNAVTGKVLFRIGKNKSEKKLIDLLKLNPVK